MSKRSRVAALAAALVVLAATATAAASPNGVGNSLLRLVGLVPQPLRAARHVAAASADPLGDTGPVTAVPPATCGEGSSPQDGVDGEVPLTDRRNGRSTKGYWCNIRLVGRYRGQGSSWVSQSYGKCAYMATRWPTTGHSPGVQIIDVSDPSHPTLAGTLATGAMLGPWESLKVNAKRGLLAADAGEPAVGDGIFDIYSIKQNCLKPQLLGQITAGSILKDLPQGLKNLPTDINAFTLFGHEGNFSPDGNTYWATSAVGGWITAIDVSDPTDPRILFSGQTGILNHGFSVADNGDTLYMSEIGNIAESLTGLPENTFKNVEPNGLAIYDVSQVQDRTPDAHISEIGHLYWGTGGAGQMSIPVTYHGVPYLIFVDELDEGGVRIINIANPARPFLVSRILLQIQTPQNLVLARRDVKGTGFFTYDSHYCTVNREVDPTTLGCSYFGSGIRLFDIADPAAPRELAYYNPPAQTGKNAQLAGSEQAGGVAMVAINDVDSGGDIGVNPAPTVGLPILSSDWCSSPGRFVGKDQFWVACQDNGFMVLKFTNGVTRLGPPARRSGHSG